MKSYTGYFCLELFSAEVFVLNATQKEVQEFYTLFVCIRIVYLDAPYAILLLGYKNTVLRSQFAG